MQKESVIKKTLVWEDSVSLAVLDTTAVVREAIARHKLSPVAAAALGRTLTASAYLCSWLKEEESSLSVSVDGGGPGGQIVVAGDGALNMRGFVGCPELWLPPRADGKLDVGGFVGREGTLTVIRDDGSGVPFVGTSPLISGEIAQDFSAYFLTSEQRPTAVALGVLIGKEGDCISAGGVFLQPLPGADDETLTRVENAAAQLVSVSSLLSERGVDGVLELIEEGAAADPDVREIRFSCRCSRERAERAVLSLGKKDALEALSEDGKIAVHCEYCNTTYTFGKEEVFSLFAVGGEDEGQ